MKLRNIEFGPVACASGTRNFHGGGYPYHRWWKLIPGFTFKGSTFVAKTTTLEPRPGNMPMKGDGITPREFKPACIVVKPWSDVTLNAVGLSGPGAKVLLERGYWQRFNEGPFFISFMAVSHTMQDRLQEWIDFTLLLKPYLRHFKQPVGLEMNFSCPNVGLEHDQALFVTEVGSALSSAEPLHIPLQVKFNGLVDIHSWLQIADHPDCDAFVMGNTLPWGELPGRVNWRHLFGSTASPLAHLPGSGGGLSGPPLLPLHCALIRDAKEKGLTKPVWGCGGIFRRRDIAAYHEAGRIDRTRSIVQGVQLGTVALHRPWRLRRLIRYGHEVF